MPRRRKRPAHPITDAEAFAQATCFVEQMGERIEIHMEPEKCSIVFHDVTDPTRSTAMLLLGHENPDLVCTGSTFATAWRKFCDYYPNARVD